jgi:hypothetical protein
MFLQLLKVNDDFWVEGELNLIALTFQLHRCLLFYKLIRIADKSTALVREYESEDLASDSDDEKRIRQAENRALKHIKEKRNRTKPYSKQSATVSRPDLLSWVQFLFQCSGSPHSKHASHWVASRRQLLGKGGWLQLNCWKLSASLLGGLETVADCLEYGFVRFLFSSDNTTRKYRYAFDRFCRWCTNYHINPLPASDFNVSLYLIHLRKKFEFSC